MIMTQKYHSANEIDQEFVPTLEELLKEYVPSFDWIVKNETHCPESTHFHYYLFFGNKHNCPVGYAQVAIKPDFEREKSFWTRMIKKAAERKRKQAQWRIPGSMGQGIIYGPAYTDSIIKQTTKLINDFSKRDDIVFQELAISKEDIDTPLVNKSKVKVIVPDTLIKVSSSYEGYIKSLNAKTADIIKDSWKHLYQGLKVNIGEYDSFKKIFEYKNAAKLYNKLKKSPLIKALSGEQTHYITLEKDKNILAMIFLVKGQKDHYFFDWISFDNTLSNLSLSQVAIMKFYEIETANRLHYLGALNEHDLFEKIGFNCSELTFFNLAGLEK